ncbi:ATP-dependent DNA helicase II [Nasonia vitripennis]|uniref:Ku domain-containing protein n=1 Tax=Nasonia vitripennis TaxID=7425 RepID=A0A7M6UUR9_NASVI|nr:ATP-dependent DNA helicase II [Nasonia vitripennis]
MPPKSKKNTLIMVTNVGSTSLQLNSVEDEPFIDKAKFAMKMLVEKKIFLQPKDEIGIITMGDETDNSQDMDYVKEYNEHLLIPNWEMVKYIDGLASTKHPCNWIEALHVALCFIKREVVNPDSTVFLVIFNNFKEDADSIENYDADNIIDDLNNYDNLHLLFVGENPLDEESQIENVTPSEEFALSVIKQTQAQYEQINNFIESRRFFMPPPTNSMAWKFNLQWAGLNIACSNYVKVTDSTKLSPWKMAAVKESLDLLIDKPKDGSNVNEIKEEDKQEVFRANIQMDVHRNEIKQENIINGYKYGGKYIPFSDDDEVAMKYSGSIKGMMVYGFVPQDEVQLECWTGSGSRLIVPETDNDAVAFYSLVQAMVEKRYAAIVRKVYANNNLPRMGVLFPKVVYDDVWGFVHIELPFVTDLRIIQKRPIQSLDGTVNKEKLDALDDFIDAMTIVDNDPEYLNPGMFPNVINQYHWNAIADRVLNPKGALLPLNGYLKKFLEPPEYLNDKVKTHYEKLRKLFGNINMHKETTKDKKSARVAPKIANEPEKTGATKDILTIGKDNDEAASDSEELDMSMGELDDL